MSSETLSQNEIDQLLDDGQAAATASSDAKQGEVGEPRLYDFRRPHRVSKERLRTLEAMYERFAKSLEGWLIGRVRDQVEINLKSVEQQSFGDFTLGLPTPCCSFTVGVGNGGGDEGVVDLGHEFGCFLVDRMMGGRGEPQILERGFTPIERMVVRTVADRVTMALREIWLDYVQLDLQITGFEAIPEILRAGGSNSPMLVAHLEVQAGGRTAVMSLCIPFVVLDSFFADAGKPRRGTPIGSAEDRERYERMNAVALRSARVPVAARLPEFRIAMGDLATLEPGSVLATGLLQNSHVELYVNDQLRFTGHAARVGRRLAVRVGDVVESSPADADARLPNS